MAGNDARIDATIPDTKENMKAAGKKYETVTYDGAGHGFMRAGEAPDATPENKKAREEGFKSLTGELKSLEIRSRVSVRIEDRKMPAKRKAG